MAIKISGTAVITDSRVITNLGQPLAISQGGLGVTSAGTVGSILVSDGTRFVSRPLVTATSVAYGWGYNSQGQIGDNTTTDRSSPVTVVGGITNWKQLATGADSNSFHALGVTQDGIAYAWGSNSFGRLGDNTTTNRSSPVTVVGGITNWQQLSANATASGGVTQGGIAYAWGDNSYGQIGDNTTTNRSSPVTVVGGITTWTQLAVGASHKLGLTQAGIVYAWGLNFEGRLGDNTITSRLSPVTVVGGITNWAQLSAGGKHNLGVTHSGIAYAWGNNYSGRLGINSQSSFGVNNNRSSPVTVVGGITNWQQVVAGGGHSLGVTQAGIAYAWGDGLGVGDNTNTNRSSPVTVAGGITNWAQLAGGDRKSFGITTAYSV